MNQGSEYGGRHATSAGVAGDETEDLYELLATVKVFHSHFLPAVLLSFQQACHPDIKGVSVGAILSNYQRVRVEHV